MLINELFEVYLKQSNPMNFATCTCSLDCHRDSDHEDHSGGGDHFDFDDHNDRWTIG